MFTMRMKPIMASVVVCISFVKHDQVFFKCTIREIYLIRENMTTISGRDDKDICRC